MPLRGEPFTGSNFKPEKGAAKTITRTHRHQRIAQTKREQLILKREEIAEEKQRRIECFARDKGRCRAFGTLLQLVTDNALKLAHCHHIKFRSQQGSDDLFNRCILSPQAHELVHAGRLKIEGEDANQPLTFTLRDSKGVVQKVWVR